MTEISPFSAGVLTPDPGHRPPLLGLMAAALKAVDPANAVRHAVSREGNALMIGDTTFDLSAISRVFVVGAGKASAPMAQVLETVLEDRIVAGWVNVRYGYAVPTEKIYIHEAGHPIPDESGVKGAKEILRILSDTKEDDLVIALISGGGSALLTFPAERISLKDLQLVNQLLLASGATINEINAVRKHLSRVKGGQLARAAHPASLVTLILSDVVGNPLDVIASGPTVPDTTTFADAWDVLERYDLVEKAPHAVVERIRGGMEGVVPETPKPGDEVFGRTRNVIVADNSVAARAAADEAAALGFHPLILTTFLEGEAREVGRVVAALAKEEAMHGRPASLPACLILGGETTVTLRGTGKGGRNQELALAAALAIRGLDGIAIASLGTDGSDGPTDAAGGLVDGSTVARGEKHGLSAEEYLQNNDSYHFLAAVGDLLKTGPTRTNVNDLVFVCVWGREGRR